MRREPYPARPAAQHFAAVTILISRAGAPDGVRLSGPMQLVELLKEPAETAARALGWALREQGRRAS